MKKWLVFFLVTALLLWTAAAAEMLCINGVTADRVHLRATPSETGASLGLYFTGTPAELLEGWVAGWARVRIGAETGYIRTEYLQASAANAMLMYQVDNRTSDWVNLRSGASFEAEAIGRLNNGDVVQLMGETASGWSYVNSGGLRGYVVTEFLSPCRELVSRIVGTTADGGYIHACEAEQGQTIYFVAMEEDPFITREDVNFDGRTDLVVATIRGTTNCYYEFFVWTGSGYVRAEHRGVEGIANYVLHPEKGYVQSSANGGNAGALYEDCLLRWEGNELRLVRRAESQNQHEYRSEGTSFVTVLHDRQAELTVFDYTADGDSTLIYEEIIDLNDMNTDKLNEMKQHLWTGLR